MLFEGPAVWRGMTTPTQTRVQLVQVCTHSLLQTAPERCRPERFSRHGIWDPSQHLNKKDWHVRSERLTVLLLLSAVPGTFFQITYITEVVKDGKV